MMNHEVEVDHIDPRWKEGRDYQLICGFEKDPKNLREIDYSSNRSKSNRFLPWRWSREELGVIPEEPGDLALFLDPKTNEWVLEEFLGEWWFKKTRYLHGSSVAVLNRIDQLREEWEVKYERLLEARPNFYEERTQKLREKDHFRKTFPKTLGKYLQENPDHQSYAFSKLLEKNPNHQSEAGSIGGSIRAEQEEFKQMSKENLKKMTDIFYTDPDHPELGICRPGLLVRRQKKHGYPHGKENRVRVE